MTVLSWAICCEQRNFSHFNGSSRLRPRCRGYAVRAAYTSVSWEQGGGRFLFLWIDNSYGPCHIGIHSGLGSATLDLGTVKGTERFLHAGSRSVADRVGAAVISLSGGGAILQSNSRYGRFREMPRQGRPDIEIPARACAGNRREGSGRIRQHPPCVRPL